MAMPRTALTCSAVRRVSCSFCSRCSVSYATSAPNTRSATDGPARAPSHVSLTASRRSTNIVSRASLSREKLSITRTAFGWRKPVRYKKSVFGLYGYGMSKDEYACDAAVRTTADLHQPGVTRHSAHRHSSELTGLVE